MKPCLVVYYSRTGITRQLAEQLALSYACDIEEIREIGSRKGFFGYMRSGREAIKGIMPPISSTSKDPAGYDTIVLGTPVWGRHMSSPMRTYIFQNRSRFNKVAAFCTMGGSGGEKVLDEIDALCGKHLTARLAVADREMRERKYAERLDSFTRLAGNPA